MTTTVFLELVLAITLGVTLAYLITAELAGGRFAGAAAIAAVSVIAAAVLIDKAGADTTFDSRGPTATIGATPTVKVNGSRIVVRWRSTVTTPKGRALVFYLAQADTCPAIARPVRRRGRRGHVLTTTLIAKPRPCAGVAYVAIDLEGRRRNLETVRVVVK